MLTLLFVDDNPAWVETLFLTFKKYNCFDLYKAIGGAEGLEAIDRIKPDIILLDLIMPVYDGVYLTNHVRNEMGKYNPYIYILSGLNTDSSIQLMGTMDIDFYSVKPISPEIIFSNVNDLITAKPIVTDYEKRMKIIEQVLSELGFSIYKAPTKHLAEAVNLYFDNEVRFMTSEVYPHVASIYQTTPAVVEKNIRHLAKKASEEKPRLYRYIFSDETDITNKVLIAELANYLRKKYKFLVQ